MPSSVFRQNENSVLELTLETSALKVLLAMLQSANSQPRIHGQDLILTITTRLLMERTGYEKNSITRGLQGLQKNQYILRKDDKKRNKNSHIPASDYLILNPERGTPMAYQEGEGLLYSAGLGHFSFPSCVITESDEEWSLAKLSPNAASLYTAICFTGNKTTFTGVKRGNVEQNAKYLYELSSMTLPTFRIALEILETVGLIYVDKSATQKLKISLCDPYTRVTLEEYAEEDIDDAANYHAPSAKGRSKRVNLNIMDSGAAMKSLRDALGAAALIEVRANDEVMILCPYHSETSPSCSMNLAKQVFKCFGCNARGTLRDLIMHVTEDSPADFVKRMVPDAEFITPGSKADEIYYYRDRTYKLIKRVLRLPDKGFRQERRVKGSWQHFDCPAMLYMLEEFDQAKTIVIVEGEKDADTVNKLQLDDRDGHRIVATTSGSASSWKDEFADEFAGTRVIVMTDDDHQGHKYADQIVESLKSRGIWTCPQF
jgi:hypothetical protein